MAKYDEESHRLSELLGTGLKNLNNKCIILGIKETAQALNLFLDEKVKLGYAEHITRNDLKMFIDSYLIEVEKNNCELKTKE